MSDILQYGNYFTFAGIQSNTYGVWISGTGTYDAPTRDVEFISIPGKSGDLMVDNGRFNNIEITYPCFISKQFESRFDVFKAALLSNKGYVILEDTYHPNYFRMAVFRGGITPQTGPYNRSGRFDITFVCIPQRFLKSGLDLVPMIAGQKPSTTLSGRVVTFNNPGDYEISNITTNIDLTQTGTGTPSPENVRPISIWSGTSVYQSGDTEPMDGVISIGYTQAGTGTPSPENVRPLLPGLRFIRDDGSTMEVYGGTLNPTTGLLTVERLVSTVRSTTSSLTSAQSTSAGFRARYSSTAIPSPRISSEASQVGSHGTYQSNAGQVGSVTGGNTFQIYPSNNYIYFYFDGCDDLDATVAYLAQQEEAGTPVQFSALVSNPATYQLTETERVRALAALGVTVFTVSWETEAGTICGGTLDITTGLLTVTWKGVVLTPDTTINDATTATNGFRIYFSWTGLPYGNRLTGTANQRCSHARYYTAGGIGSATAESRFMAYNTNNRVYLYIEGKDTVDDTEAYITEQYNAGTPIQIAVKLATPATYQLTPMEISTLTGTNKIWTDTGDITLTYQEPFSITNPTLYSAKPNIRVYGSGTLGVGQDTITIAPNTLPYIDLDCEAQDAFYNTTNANRYITLSGDSFPELAPGVTKLQLSGDITEIEIMPRWWTI